MVLRQIVNMSAYLLLWVYGLCGQKAIFYTNKSVELSCLNYTVGGY